MEGPLSVLHVIERIAERYGGPQHNVRDVCAALAARGHRVMVLTTDRDGTQRLSDVERRSLSSAHAWEVARVPPRGPALSRAFVGSSRKLVRGADLVHLHGIYSPATAVAAVAAIAQGVPYVQQLHGAATDYHWRQKRWKKAPYEALVQRPVMARASAVISMTEMEADQASRVFPAARMRILAPPVVEENGKVGSRQRPTESEVDGPQTIGFLGRLSEKKGAPILLGAFKRIVQEFPQARLVVAGPDDEDIGTRMKEEVRRSGLETRVSFPGLLLGEAKAALLGQIDIFALPSADESLGIAVVEAMHSGLPVVITDHVAIAGDVRSADAGIIAPRSEEGFADALRRLLRDRPEAARMGAAGQDLAVRKFSRSASTDGLERIYAEVMEAHQAAG